MRQEKQRACPIPGQSRLEKAVDWLGREETLKRWMTRWSVLWVIWCGTTLLTVKVLGMPGVGRWLVMLLVPCTPVMLAGMLLMALTSLWRELTEKRFRARILQSVTERGSCAYDELAACCCRRRKLRLGVDGALKTLLDRCELVCDEGEAGVPCYRLPTEEDLRRWRRESAETCGMTISFRELELLFEREWEQGLNMNICVDDRDVYLYKPGRDETPVRYQCDMEVYPTFQALADAPLFNGKSLRQVWDDAIVTDINDQWPEFWLHEHLPEDGPI